MSGAMIAVSRCLYVVKSDIFDKIFARFNGKLLATGIWVISILYIIPVFLEVHTFRLYLFRNRISYIFFHQLNQKRTSDMYMIRIQFFWIHFVRFKRNCPFSFLPNSDLILTDLDLNPDWKQLCALIMYKGGTYLDRSSMYNILSYLMKEYELLKKNSL